MVGDHFMFPAWQKAIHAERHLEVLSDEIAQYLERRPLTITSEIDRDRSLYIGRLSIREPAPEIWSLVVGDFVNNLRAALDHAVCRLVEQAGCPITAAHAFPILDAAPDSPSKKKQWDARIHGVEPEHRHIIEGLQPYAQFSDSSDAPLHNLRELSNEDKHRVILARYTAIPPRSDIEVFVGECRDVEPIERVELEANKPLEDGMEVLRADVQITGPEPEAALSSDLPVSAAFGRQMVRLSGLAQIRDAVAATLEMLSAPASALHVHRPR